MNILITHVSDQIAKFIGLFYRLKHQNLLIYIINSVAGIAVCCIQDCNVALYSGTKIHKKLLKN